MITHNKKGEVLMMNWTNILLIVNLLSGLVIGLYFWNLLKNQRTQKVSVDRESKKEIEQLHQLRRISLNVPLSEKVRPTTFADIVGQEDGIQVLKAALCGPNPQHVIIYGPPGVGKTAAARLVLDEAKKQILSPFRKEAKFVELDATTARFDDRGIADPLIGSVHDPIYQGAGPLGQAGIPQPKKGAVTDAHGGVLFIDEIGELHPVQMNKLLKVLEDRKVFLESAYYNEESTVIPSHIHDIFKNGLPADFRLVGATTRSPNELPPAIRSRCLEIYFRQLEPEEIMEVAKGAAEKIHIAMEEDCLELISAYATNGRDAINLVQLIGGMLMTEERTEVTMKDVQWVIESSRLTPKYEKKIYPQPRIGVVNGLAIHGPDIGSILEIEVTAVKAENKGELVVTGIVDEESMGGNGKSIRRKSMARGSVENVMTVLRNFGLVTQEYHIHVNFPGGIPVDGPSAGIAMAVGIFSAVSGLSVNNKIAMTGEISIHGHVKPIGGVYGKIRAAKKAGAETVLIPEENMQDLLKRIEEIEIIPVSHINEVFQYVFGNSLSRKEKNDPSQTA